MCVCVLSTSDEEKEFKKVTFPPQTRISRKSLLMDTLTSHLIVYPTTLSNTSGD